MRAAAAALVPFTHFYVKLVFAAPESFVDSANSHLGIGLRNAAVRRRPRIAAHCNRAPAGSPAVT
jgi:hypothetical protein